MGWDVTIVELGTFGAVMKFAMQLEASALSYYETNLNRATNPDLSGLIIKIKTKVENRSKLLERVRRENVTEMILEPIVGLESEDYSLDTNVPETADDRSFTEITIALEETRQSFFETRSEKIEFLIEAASAFERLADENGDWVESLKGYL